MEVRGTSSYIETGVKALAFAALNRFDTLNSLVNRMTGGSINRDTLAQKVMRDGIHMALQASLPLSLQDRQATILPLLAKLVHGDTREEVSTSIKELADVLTTVDHRPTDDMAATLKTMGKEAGRLAAAGLASIAAQHINETHLVEKVLHTMLKEHGWTSLDNYMESMLTALPFGKGFAANLGKNLLQRAVLDRPEFDRSHSPEFRLLADEAHASITDQAYSKPLANYFLRSAAADMPAALDNVTKAGLGIAETTLLTSKVLAKGVSDVTENLQQSQYSQALINTGTTLLQAGTTLAHGVFHDIAPALTQASGDLAKVSGKTALAGLAYVTPIAYQGALSFYQGTKPWIDSTQHALVGAPASQDVRKAYAKDIAQAQTSPPLAAPVPQAHGSDSQWVDQLARQHAIALDATPDAPPSTHERLASVVEAFQLGQIDSARYGALAQLTEQLDVEQLSPFGALSGSLKTAHNVSGNLARLESESLASMALDTATAQTMGAVIDASTVKESSKGGYKVADVYARQVGQLALDFPAGVYSHTDAGLDTAKAASNYTLGSWGYPDVGAADWAELRKLHNTCGGNEQLTLKVSSYLDPAMASQALAAPVLGALDPQDSGLLHLPTGLQLQLTEAMPQYQYQLRRDGENVVLTISAAWDIAQYGTDAQQLRSPQGEQTSQLTAAIHITVSPNGSATASAPSLQCAIRNAFKFDSYGALQASATPQPEISVSHLAHFGAPLDPALAAT